MSRNGYNGYGYGRKSRTVAETKRLIFVAMFVIIAIAIVAFGVLMTHRKNEPQPDNTKKSHAEGAISNLSNDNNDDEEEEDLRVTQKNEEQIAHYADKQNEYLETLPTGRVAKAQTFLNCQVGGDMKDGIANPMVVKQSEVDLLLPKYSTESELQEALQRMLEEDLEAIRKLPLADQEAEIMARLGKKLMNPKYGHAFARMLNTYPSFAKQNPWLTEFLDQAKEAMSRSGEDGRPSGWWCFIQYGDEEAKKNHDFSKLVMSHTTDEKTGMYDYWNTYTYLVETIKQLFLYRGEQDDVETDIHYCKSNAVGWAHNIFVRAHYTDSRPAFIYEHVNKAGVVTMRIGFNSADSRPERFDKEKQKERSDTSSDDEPEPPVTEDLPDPDPGDGKVKLTVHYRTWDGNKAADDSVTYWLIGRNYKVVSPVLPDMKADRPIVEGGPITKDTVEKVTYYPNSKETHIASIHYYYKDSGKPAAASFIKEMTPGEEVTRKSPKIDGYTPDKARVTIKMEHESISIDVFYIKDRQAPTKHTLTRVYKYADGTTAHPTETSKLAYGDHYKYKVPEVADATPNRKFIEGDMPNNDYTEVVIYTRNDREDPKFKLTVNFVVLDGGVPNPESVVEYYAYGEEYNVPAAKVPGYIPNRNYAKGVMPAHDTVETITYTKREVLYALDITYVVADGKEPAPAPVHKVLAAGTEYSFLSEPITGYTPDKAVVKGIMPNAPQSFVVTYRRNVHKLTVQYRVVGGDAQAPATVIENHPYGEHYSVPSKSLDGYTVDKSSVYGDMPDHDVTETVTYTKVKPKDVTVTVVYSIDDGQVAAPAPKSATGQPGADYAIPSPDVSGYVASDVVKSGRFKDHDETLYVTYRRQDGNGVKDSNDDPVVKNPNGTDQGGGDRKDGLEDSQQKEEDDRKDTVQNSGGNSSGSSGTSGDTGQPDRKPITGEASGDTGKENGGGGSGTSNGGVSSGTVADDDDNFDVINSAQQTKAAAEAERLQAEQAERDRQAAEAAAQAEELQRQQEAERLQAEQAERDRQAAEAAAQAQQSQVADEGQFSEIER